ncbi:MAG: hypothetical protein COT73_06090 [Bdellovibrio sp. CG10_big_fil_rev_8_21_14_0_10_47_8]|nr:MAG: hypothetical protein COT73_06090 [Bdellovibrio sp. CG10_big_fil_rev_8_21_14_0_10_47_8]
MSLLTAATVDYVSQAVVTFKSARRHNSFQSFHIFVADAVPESMTAIREVLGRDAEWIHLFGPEDLGPAAPRYLQTFEYYNPFEVSNVAKYTGVLHVLKKPDAADACVYIDADTLFLGDIFPLIQTEAKTAVYLSPHLLGPLTGESEHEILVHGWINTGFSVFRRDNPKTFSILEWLIDRISHRGFCAPQLGMFVDQLWASSLPFIFREHVTICRYAGLNVAYWNLRERVLTMRGEEILASGVPLLMFHFSGFLPKNPEKLSKHVNLGVEPGSILDKVCQIYRNELLSVESLRLGIQGLQAIPCSKENLAKRMAACFKIHGEDLVKTIARPGVFSTLDARMAAASVRIRKIFSR